MRWIFPPDPDCPGYKEVGKRIQNLCDDPMTQAYGAPVEEFAEKWLGEHVLQCERCRNHGAANAEVE